MLVLSAIRDLLVQVLSPPDFHTAALFTPSGQLISYAVNPPRPKDKVRVVVGLSGEVWQETREQGYGVVDSEVGRIVVIPVKDEALEDDAGTSDSLDWQPLMLLALNAAPQYNTEEMISKGQVLARHLSKHLSKFRTYLASPKPPATVSPVP
ncbi:hypothetical protein FISHEDRAFT_21420, partial [Fistulina hepatica ATCC 64428]